MDGERGRPGAPGQPVSVKTLDFLTPQFCHSVYIIQVFYQGFNLNNCDFQGHPGPRGQQGLKGAKGDQVSN